MKWLSVPALLIALVILAGVWLGCEGTSTPVPRLALTPTPTPVAVSIATPTSAPTPAPPTPAPAPRIYTVQPGDTLSAIAKAHGVTVQALVVANDITDPSLIRVGQELIIPAAGEVLTVATPPSQTARGVTAQVVRVIDGDTIEVEIEGQAYRVRYIGINTPERDEFFYQEATKANAQLVAGQTVVLEKDVSETDRYGRLLRYVWVGETMINAELVRRGYAQVATYPPDVKYQELFLELEREARKASRGLWEVTAKPVAPTLAPSAGPGKVAVDGDCSQFNAPGNDNYNKEAEWVCFTNIGGQAADITGWVLHDEYGWRYTFPAFSLGPGQTVRVHTGCGRNTAMDLYWCKDGTAVWNNDGDTVFLLDAAGNLVAKYSY